MGDVFAPDAVSCGEREMADQFLTVDEAAKRLQCHPDTVGNMRRDGIIKGAEVGTGLWHVPESSLQAFLDEPAWSAAPDVDLARNGDVE